MTVDEARNLFAYDQWANGRLIAVIEGLDEERLTRPIESSFPSLLATFAHLVGAEWVWLRRWQGESPTSFPEWLADPFTALRDRLAAVDDDRLAFVATLDAAALDRPIVYRTLAGAEHRNRLATLIFHAVNHASYHRGQLTTMLRQLGATPVSTDLIVFERRAG